MDTLRRLASVGTKLSSLLVLCVVTRAQPTGTRELEDITFVVPANWVTEDIQGVPNLKAHYVLKQGGRPYGEFYLSSEKLTAPKTLDVVVQEGIAKLRSSVSDYQPLTTTRRSIAGREGARHEFRYFLGTSFTGRADVLLVEDTVYTFFFNTVTSYFASVAPSFESIVGSVKIRPRPAVTEPTDQPKSLEEHGLVFVLPAGWTPSGDAAGAKYRLQRDGRLLASFFPLRSERPLFEHFGTLESHMEAFVENAAKDFEREWQNYRPGARTRKTVNGLDVWILEFTTEQGGTKGFFRWYYIPLKEKEDEGAIEYPWFPRMFGFYTTQLGELDALMAQFDAIVDTLKRKPKPAAPEGDELPPLEDEPPPTPQHRDAQGRFTFPLPEGAILLAREGPVSRYEVATKNLRFEVHELTAATEGPTVVERIADGKRQNGQDVTWDVAGKTARVRVYTWKNEANESQATITALFEARCLVLVIELAANAYGDSRPWIQTLVKSVRFRD